MKTFSEAFESLPVLKVDLTEQGIVDGMNRTTDDDFYHRFEHLPEEAENNPAFKQQMDSWMLLLRHNPVAAIFSAFMTGLITGIEMEKTPLADSANAANPNPSKTAEKSANTKA